LLAVAGRDSKRSTLSIFRGSLSMQKREHLRDGLSTLGEVREPAEEKMAPVRLQLHQGTPPTLAAVSAWRLEWLRLLAGLPEEVRP
jgi:hypothetical protein